MKTRSQIVIEAKRIHAEINQLFRDSDHWNNSVRKPEEIPIDPDPDGRLRLLRSSLSGTIVPEVMAKFPFADEASRDAARWAFQRERQPRLFVINANRPGLGKTLLAQECLQHQFGMDAGSCCSWPSTKSAEGAMYVEAVKRGFLFVDDVPDKALRSPEFLMFVTSSFWSWRIPRSRPMRADSRENHTCVFITGNDLTLSPDIFRRAKVINLFRKGGVR